MFITPEQPSTTVEQIQDLMRQVENIVLECKDLTILAAQLVAENNDLRDQNHAMRKRIKQLEELTTL